MQTISTNKRALFDYKILERFEAGIVLFGHEVKSVKEGHINLKGSFITLKGKEAFLTNANIPLYSHSGNILNYNPTRPRKLLLKKREIKALLGKVKTERLTLVPIRVYTKNRLIKVEFGMAKGKKKYDKREVIKKRDIEKRIRAKLKNIKR